MKTCKIFAYGTLLLEEVQEKLFARIAHSYDAVLEDYSINIGEEYYNVIAHKGAKVKGKILELSELELLYVDQWEEIPQTFHPCFSERVKRQILTLYLVELFIFQSAIIHETKKLIEQLVDETQNVKENFKSGIESLLIKSKNYWDIHQLLYPTARELANKIGNAMNMTALYAYHQQNEIMVEKLLQMHKLKQEEIENGAMNALLLVISLLSLIPIVSDIIIKFFEEGLLSINILSYSVSIFSCFSIWIIYRIMIYRRRKRKK